MGKDTKIPWCDNSWSPWWGCVAYSAACKNCYAEALAKRFGHDCWGGSPRRMMSPRHWKQPHTWNRTARAASTPLLGSARPRVFCGSMCDVFEENPDLRMARAELWKLIVDTPHLDWLLLTKRPENFETMLPLAPGSHPMQNVWLGVTAENQEEADRRIPILLDTPAVVRFVSIEPILEAVDISRYLGAQGLGGNTPGELSVNRGCSWVICGDESGPRRRPADLDWVRSIRDQCAETSTPFFLKQLHEGIRKIECPELDGRQHLEFPR